MSICWKLYTNKSYNTSTTDVEKQTKYYHFIVNTGSESKTLRSKDHGMIFKMTLDPEFLIFYNAPLALQGHHPQRPQAGLIRTQLRRHRRHRCRRLQPIQGETVLAVS